MPQIVNRSNARHTDPQRSTGMWTPVIAFLLIIGPALCVSAESSGATANETECPSAQGTTTPTTPRDKRHGQFYINGTWVEPSVSPRTLYPVIDPSINEAVTAISLATQVDVDAAVSAARHALPSWSLRTSPDERRAYVEKLLDLYEERAEDIAQAISTEMGAPIDMAREDQVGSGSYQIESFLDALEQFEFERTVPGVEQDEDDEHDPPGTKIFMDAIGVVALITPWNWPMNQVVLKAVAALLVGNTAVLKPSEHAPLSALIFAELIDEAGFPPGVFNLINGDGVGAGSQLSSHPGVDMVSFTGSTRAGAAISKAAADTFKRVSLELGGKGANIIFEDVGDALEDIVWSGAWSVFSNSGQTCNAPTRMLVERTVYDEAVDIARAVAVDEVTVASAHEEGKHIGPVVSQSQFDRIQQYIHIGIDEGARLVAGGLGRPEHGTNGRGFYVRPTVFADCDNKMRIMQEEIFGPVLCIAPFDTEEESLEIANNTPYGLTNYVHSSSRNRRRRMARALKSGMVEMNGSGQDDGFPFGGVKASGTGREGGVYGLEEFCVVKAVSGW